MPTKSKRSLKGVVGDETYQVWVAMLRSLVPGGRTERLSVVVAGMLQYAADLAAANDAADENSVANSLAASTEVGDPDEVKELLHDVVKQLFKDAGVTFERTSARGQNYSIADETYAEYVNWYNLPWE